MILVVNLGLKSIRAIGFDDDGVKKVSAARLVETRLTGSRVEQDPEAWWRLALEVMGEALSGREAREALAGLTVTSSSCCLVCLDEEGRVLRPAMMVSDHRAEKEAEEMGRGTAFREVKRLPGNLVAEPSFMLPKIMWLRKHEPEVFARTRRFVSANDFLVERLTGEVVTDPLNAEKFGYSTEAEAYPAALLGEMGLEEERLPAVRSQGTVAGPLRAKVTETLGLGAAEVPVVLTTYDALCAFFGSGPGEEGDACDVSGTVTSLRVLTKRPFRDAGARIYSQYEAQTGRHIVGGSNNLGGGLIEWAKQCLYEGVEEPYGLMEEEAAGVGPGAGGLVFLPYLLGERAPLWDLQARGVFFGLERRHQRRHMVRAVFESAAYSLVYLKEAIEGLGCPVKRLRVSGGLARVELIARIKADVLGVPVEVVEEFETTSLGAFLLASVALGRVGSLEEASRIVRVKSTLHPDESRGRVYREVIAFYQELYETSRPLFARRVAMMEAIQEGTSVSIENL